MDKAGDIRVAVDERWEDIDGRGTRKGAIKGIADDADRHKATF